MPMMNLGEITRRTVFWAIDALRSPSIAAQYGDLKQQLTAGPTALAVRQERLQALLSHATATTQFYRRYQGCSDLAQFPVVQKRQISDQRQLFESSEYANRRLPVMRTSGSTGMPMEFRFSWLKRRRQLAEVIYYSELTGFRLGMRHANVRCLQNKKAFRYWMENQILFDPLVVSEDWLARCRAALKQPSLGFMAGYARPLAAIADYCRREGDRPEMFALKAVVSTAEGLEADEREAIEGVFGCPVFNRYGCQEFGVLAQECQACRRLHLNTASYATEFLALDHDTPVAAGEIGRVVITDLFSYAMPLIRYDIGDLASSRPDPCPCGDPTPTLGQLEGRLLETVLNPQGRMVSPHFTTTRLRTVGGVVQFQFLQKSRDQYELLLVVKAGFDQEQKVRHLFGECLGPQAILAIRYVDKIPPLPSGKRPFVINEYLKAQHSSRQTIR